MPITHNSHQQAVGGAEMRGWEYTKYATVAAMNLVTGRPGEICTVTATGDNYYWDAVAAGWQRFRQTSRMYPFLRTAAGVLNADITADVTAGRLAVGDSLHTGAYYQNGIDGGCDYQVVAAGTGTANNGSFVTAGALQLRAQFGSPMTVMQWGARGDGTTDDTAACQAAMDFAAGSTSHREVVWPSGHEYVITNLDLAEGVVCLGYGATLKRPANQPNWTIFFQTFNRYASAVDGGPPAVIAGFTLDGNRANQGAYTAFELQQAHLIFIAGNTEYFKCNVRDVACKEGTADGIQIWRDATVNISNVSFWNLFRSSMSVTGGGNTVNIDGATCDGDVHMSGIDIELDSASTITPATPRKSIITARGIVTQDPALRPGADRFSQQFDVQDGGTILLSDCVLRGDMWVYQKPGSRFVATNSELHWDGTRTFSKVQEPSSVAFVGCTHVAHNRSGAAAVPYLPCISILMGSTTAGTTNADVSFVNCRWEAGPTTSGDVLYAVGVMADDMANNNQLRITGGFVPSSYDGVLRMEQGGNAIVGGDLHTAAGALLWADEVLLPAPYPFDLRVGQVFFEPGATTFAHIERATALSSLLTTITMPATAAPLTTGGGFANLRVFGRRTITADADAAGSSLRGDLWIRNATVGGSAWQWVANASSVAGSWLDISGTATTSIVNITVTGDGATTVFTVPHNLALTTPFLPSSITVLDPAGNILSGSSYALSAPTANNFTVTFAVAPANAAVHTFRVTA